MSIETYFESFHCVEFKPQNKALKMKRSLLFFSRKIAYAFELISKASLQIVRHGKQRNIFLFGLGFCLAAGTLSAAETDEELEKKYIDQTLNFARGHSEFKELYFKQYEPEFIRLVQQGQSPQILFISCSDSRVIPDLMLNTRPGDLFVIRTAGNFVPPASANQSDGVAATIQYAVEVLNVKHIIICGHSDCGAIAGLYKTLEPEKLGILDRWIRWGEPAKKIALLATKLTNFNENILPITEQISVLYQLENLLTYPFIKNRVDQGTIQLHGWYFEIDTGELSYYDIQKHGFVPLIKKQGGINAAQNPPTNQKVELKK